MINWKLLDGFDVTDLRFLREPVLWVTVAATLLTVLADGLAAGWGWRPLPRCWVNAVFGLLARAQVSPPQPGRQELAARAVVEDNDPDEWPPA